MSQKQTATTINAVLKYAAQTRADAEAQLRRDCYAKPYRIDDETAKRLVRTCARARLLQLPLEATPEEREAARALGPSDAKAIIALRVIQARTEYHTEKYEAEKKDNRHRNHQDRARKAREAELSNLTIGQRIDRALRALSTVSGVTAANLEADRVTGSKEHGIQVNEAGEAYVDEPLKRAKGIAEAAMRKVEQEAESARRRLVELEAA